jgi:hypothetical protein
MNNEMKTMIREIRDDTEGIREENKVLREELAAAREKKGELRKELAAVRGRERERRKMAKTKEKISGNERR